MNAIAKVTSKGQVTLPSKVRKALRIDVGDKVVFDYSSGGTASIRVIKQRPLSTFRGALASTVRHPGKARLREVVRDDLGRRASRE